jgi:hypothetical protein
MKHLRAGVVSLVSLVSVLGLMGILALSAYTDPPSSRAKLCNDQDRCDILPHPPQADSDKAPTLAPPRADARSTVNNSSRTSTSGQPVFVQVKTDYADIEVSWAPADRFGR